MSPICKPKCAAKRHRPSPRATPPKACPKCGTKMLVDYVYETGQKYFVCPDCHRLEPYVKRGRRQTKE